MALSFSQTKALTRRRSIKLRETTTKLIPLKYSKRLKPNDKTKHITKIPEYVDTCQETCDELLKKKLKQNHKLYTQLVDEDTHTSLKLQELRQKLVELNEDNLQLNKNLNKIEHECESRLEAIENWYKNKRNEIKCQYDGECKHAAQEFNDKRKELKENLRTEYEDKKRLVEVERTLLDINMDSNELKPQVTRKLRRRGGQQHQEYKPHLSSNSIIITSNSLSTVTLCPSTNQISTFLLSERKRRPSPVIQFVCALNDDDVNDDLKLLNRNVSTRNNS